MKEYKETYGHYTIFSKNERYYVINNKPHGLFTLISIISNIITHKGIYNVHVNGRKISHWKEYNAL